MRQTLFVLLLSALYLSGCKETVIENQVPKEFTNDLLHADLVGKVTQKNSGAMVIVSQVSPIDSVLISSQDGSFAFHDLRAGNYDLTIRADNYRIYLRNNLSLPGGGVTYTGEIDLSTTPDLVDQFYPANNSEIVYDWRYGRISISVIFTHPMDRASVEKAFSTNPASDGVFYWGQYSQAPRSVLYSADAMSGFDKGATITTFSKISSFTYSVSQKDSYVDTLYSVTLSTIARDTMGNQLRFPLRFSFRTVQSYTTIYGIQSNPVHGDIDVDPVNNSSGITVTFPRRMNPASTEAATTVAPSMNRIFLWPEENVLRIYTGGPFLSDTTITVRIDSTALDKDGIRLGQIFTFWFKTAPFQVTGTSPANAQLFVPLSQQIYINFNNYVTLSSAQPPSISIAPSIGGSYSYGGNYPNETQNQIVFTPSGSYQPNTKYSVTVGTTVKDMYGFPMKAPYTFSFVTRPN
jgi:hypothetical protein